MPTSSSGGDSVVEIEVTFNPPNEIVAEPDHARVDWGKRQTARWTLTSEDEGAVLRGIRFQDHPEGKPFGALSQHPSNGKVWQGDQTNEVTGTFKYDIVVVDGEGNQVVLDPRLTTGNPPG